MPSPRPRPLQISCDGPAFGGRAGRVVRDHARGFPVAGQHDFRGGRAARGGGEAALNLQRRQPDHPICGGGVECADEFAGGKASRQF